jgi:hypothetical protein
LFSSQQLEEGARLSKSDDVYIAFWALQAIELVSDAISYLFPRLSLRHWFVNDRDPENWSIKKSLC